MSTKGAKARAALAATDPTMAALIERVGEIDLATRLRRRSEERPADAYGALLRAIVGQQLSTKAARTIYLRVCDLFDGTTPSPEQLLEASEEDLRGCGLSGRKVEYVRDLAAHVLAGELELDRLGELSDEEAIEEIVAVRGLGQWTAEMFLLFHLERPDVLSGGDLGIRKAVQIEYGLEEMPTPQRVLEIGEPWRPHRSLASLYLWESLAAFRGVRVAARLAETERNAPPLLARLRGRRRDRGRLGRRSRLLVRARETRPLPADCSATRRRARRARPRRSPRLSVGQLASAAAFFQAASQLTRHEFDVMADSLLGNGALSGTAFVLSVPGSDRARFERRHGYPIVERAGLGLPPRPASRAHYFPVTFAASDSGLEAAARLRPRLRPRARSLPAAGPATAASRRRPGSCPCRSAAPGSTSSAPSTATARRPRPSPSAAPR